MAFSFVLATLVARNALSCSCSPQSYGPACALITTRDIIFTGRVDFSNDDGSGKFTQGTVVRFAVEEAFKGLPAGTKEAWIDPGSFTSCYVEFEVGKRYLVFASDGGKAGDSIVAMTVMTDGKQRKPVPPGFDISNPPRVYLSAGCHGSRPLEFAESDLKWLRAWARGANDTRIFGRVLEHYDMHFLPPLDEPLVGALVTVRGSGGSYRAISNQNGAYEINGVAPGKYTLNASLDRYRPVENIKLEIAPKACAYVNIGLRTTGRIEGIVRGPDGKPVVGVPLEIARVLADGKLKHNYWTRVTADLQGRFGFEGLPSGDFFLGINLQRGPTLRIP